MNIYDKRLDNTVPIWTLLPGDTFALRGDICLAVANNLDRDEMATGSTGIYVNLTKNSIERIDVDTHVTQVSSDMYVYHQGKEE